MRRRTGGKGGGRDNFFIFPLQLFDTDHVMTLKNKTKNKYKIKYVKVYTK